MQDLIELGWDISEYTEMGAGLVFGLHHETDTEIVYISYN